MSEGINFYGIDADRTSPLHAAERGPDWTLSDLPWRACWLRSEYHRLSGGGVSHSLAAMLGSLTGAGLAYGLILIWSACR